MAAASEKPPRVLSKPITFATAGLGGILGWLVVHPANTCAVRMNLLAGTLPQGEKLPSFFKFSSQLVKSEGVSSLYNGLGAGCIRQVFYATSRFGLFEVFRDELAKHRETDFLSRVTTAMAAGGCAAMISSPAEVCLVRMSNDNALPAEMQRNYKSIVDAAVRITKEEGPAAFYRGVVPFTQRAMLVGACQVATFDEFKQRYAKLMPTVAPTGSYSNVFVAAMSSGLFYASVTMPLESAKNRMASQKPLADGKYLYKSTGQTMQLVAKNEGVLALWNGFLPYYLRCGGHTVTMFIFVGALRDVYWKSKGQ